MSRTKRVLSFILAIVISLSSTLPVLADNSGSTYVPPTPPQNMGGGNAGNPVFATYKQWGFRITMATSNPILEANVPELGDTYTTEDLNSNYEAIKDITNTRYWEPGE